MKVWAHTLVRNEEKYLWFAVSSVADYVDKVMLWDTGSGDNTLLVVEELRKKYPDKIEFEEVGEIDVDGFTQVRQRMLDKTKSDWFIIVDGDEVWWDSSIGEVRRLIEEKGDSLETVVSRYYNVVGDVYHYQEENAGRYKIDGKVGHLTIRAINRKIPGLHFEKPHGQQGLVDGAGLLIQNRDPSKRFWAQNYSYLHFTFMPRSSSRDEDLKVPKRKIKIKYELGREFPRDFYYPEVFFRPKPPVVKDIWERADWQYLLRAGLETPLKKIKRIVFPSKKSGY
jgi:glycosyltransferase involved in cell wall biosynthesis